MRNLLLPLFTLLFCSQSLMAATSSNDDGIKYPTDSLSADTTSIINLNKPESSIDSTDTLQAAVPGDTAKVKRNIFQRFIAYFGDANKENNKRFDINFIGGPYYSSDTKLGIGLVGAGLYRMSGCPKSMQPSNVSIFSSFSRSPSMNAPETMSMGVNWVRSRNCM